MTPDVVVEKNDPTYAGQAIYTTGMLRLYNLLTFKYNLPVLWRCSQHDLLALYESNVTVRHLDVGVGTGYLLERCDLPSSTTKITLMDLNPNPLNYAARRLRRFEPSVHQADVLTPWHLPAGAFESVALVNLLHCLPGNMGEKSFVFEQTHLALAPGGVLFGATVLGDGVDLSRRARRKMEKFNRRGIFSNLEDNLEDLRNGLGRVFGGCEVEMRGAVALFTAQKANDETEKEPVENGA
jgi:SAM-dependent methyltransferase